MAVVAVVLDFILDRLAIFDYKYPNYFLPRFASTGLFVQEKLRIVSKDGGRCGHRGFPIETILASFN